jgi:hypothetical protein
MRTTTATGIGLIAVCLLGLNGCGKGTPDGAAAGDSADAHEEEHDHGKEGPHGGHIIELGTEEHHAELTHDDASHKVGVYLLGDDAKTAKPIDAESITINVSVDGEPSQYVLPAAPQIGEVEGQSSYFELVSEPLALIVSGKSEAAKKQARLSLTIGGKPYSGLIETEAHDHDHGHEH